MMMRLNAVPYIYNFYGSIADSPQHRFTVIKQVACAGHRSFSLCHSLPFKQRCFITVTRAQDKGARREQSSPCVSFEWFMGSR